MKLGHKDIEPSDKRFSCSHARGLFLDAITENAPDVLEQLLGIAKDSSINSDLTYLANLNRWAKRWHLNSDWILAIAHDTIISWKQFPMYTENSVEFSVSDILALQNNLSIPAEVMKMLEHQKDKANSKISLAESSVLVKQFIEANIPYQEILRKLSWFPISVGWRVELNQLKRPKPPRGLPAWEADSESHASYIKRVDERIKEALKEDFFSDISEEVKAAKMNVVEKYCHKVIRAYLRLKDSQKKPLWVPTEAKTMNLQDHALWTVRYQILEEDYSDIAISEKVSNHSIVIRAVQDFLDIIKLDKRQTKRGRRKGQTMKKILDKRHKRYAPK